jgi:uncharacterized protein (DUF736 family)
MPTTPAGSTTDVGGSWLRPSSAGCRGQPRRMPRLAGDDGTAPAPREARSPPLHRTSSRPGRRIAGAGAGWFRFRFEGGLAVKRTGRPPIADALDHIRVSPHPQRSPQRPVLSERQGLSMATIGTFFRQGNVIEGRVKTLQFQEQVRLVPNPDVSSVVRAPDYLIYSGDVEIGGAWAIKKNNRTVYYNVRIDDVSLARPINATLYQSEEDNDHFDLVWSR